MGRAAYKCCVIGCTSKGVSSHRFPNPRTFFEMFQKWLTTLGSERFENIQHLLMTSPGTKKLKHNVLPHLMMFKLVSTDVNNVISPIVNVEQSVLTQDLNQLESALKV
ncbi:THAP-type domain-containing protein [Aphis craccivora]|uniref:THAP-type domain-containing protein n=1 Tax=Aphis craccivora TaxID=307492 RepID=A0A6G0Y1W1_APHCR|nr:THAP-type domain-containing protein [Aphis craccivora]